MFWPFGAPPEGLAGMAELAPLFPGGGGAKPLLFTFYNPQALSNVQEENLSQ
jgi:hypothetical protein